jgi:membrane dipeptidase
MIMELSRNGGVIMINFGSSFLTDDFRRKEQEISEYLRSHRLDWDDHEAQEYVERYHREHPPAYADVADVADHIDHVVRLAGVDHVGLGSDFDGVGDSLPTGLKDVSEYPNLIEVLLRRGYGEADIRKICGENLLRVWSAVEARARELQNATGSSGSPQ